MNQHARRAIIAFFLLLVAGGAHAQDYPSRPVRIVVPYPPGGAAVAALKLIPVLD